MSQFVILESFQTRVEAEVVKGYLEAHNIQAFISADDAGGMEPFPLQYVYGVELHVLKAEFEKAKKLLEKK